MGIIEEPSFVTILREDGIRRCRERGYLVLSHNEEKTIYYTINQNSRIKMKLYMESFEFEMSYSDGFITLTTDKCMGFANDVNFSLIEDRMLEAIRKLNV